MKISEKKLSFFSTLNQYFPHIPYVASKNQFNRWAVTARDRRKFC
jgi:hypothetical protein